MNSTYTLYLMAILAFTSCTTESSKPTPEKNSKPETTLPTAPPPSPASEDTPTESLANSPSTPITKNPKPRELDSTKKATPEPLIPSHNSICSSPSGCNNDQKMDPPFSGPGAESTYQPVPQHHSRPPLSPHTPEERQRFEEMAAKSNDPNPLHRRSAIDGLRLLGGLDSDILSEIASKLQDESPLVREASALALWTLSKKPEGQKVKNHLAELQKAILAQLDSTEYTANWSLNAIAELKLSPSEIFLVLPEIHRAIKEGTPRIQADAAYAVQKLDILNIETQNKAELPAIDDIEIALTTHFLGHANPLVRAASLTALTSNFRNRDRLNRAFIAISSAIEFDKSSYVRETALRAAIRLYDVGSPLLPALNFAANNDKDSRNRDLARIAIRKISFYIDFKNDPDSLLRR